MLQFGRQIHDLGRDVVVLGLGQRTPVVDLPGPGVEPAHGKSERTADVANSRTWTIRDDVGDLCRAIPPVAVVHVLDHQFSSTTFDVQIDIRRPVTFRGKESLEEQIQPDRVNVGDPERVAHGAVGGRATALAVDVAAPAEFDEVPDDEEISGKTELVDEVQLVLYLLVGLEVPFRRPVSLSGSLGHQNPQETHLVMSVRDREVGQFRRYEREVESTGPAEFGSPGHRPGKAVEPQRLLLPRTQVRRPGGRQPTVHLVERPPCSDGGERGRERTTCRRGVVNVVRRDCRQPPDRGQRRERVVALVVMRIAMTPQLDRDVVPPEHFHQFVEPGRGRGRTLGSKRRGHHSFAAAGEHEPVAVMRIGQLGQVIDRLPFLSATGLGNADRT